MEIIIIALATFGLVAFFGFLFEQFSANRDRQRFSEPPGERFKVDGHELHALIEGRDQPGPSVVLEAGIGGSAQEWSLILPQVGQFAPVIAYDRAGYGWSSEGPAPRDPVRLVDELHSLLEQASFSGPLVLVGHSFGGLFMRLFADTYPDRVAGMVLVDSAHPDMLQKRDIDDEMKRLRRVELFKRVGMLRLMMRNVLRDRVDNLPPEVRASYVAYNLLNTGTVPTEAFPIFSEGIELSDSLGNIPLVVISRSPVETSGSRRWQEYQEDLLNLADGSRRIVSDRGNHYVQLAEPEIVVRAIRQVVEQVRGRNERFNEMDDVADLN